MIALFQQEGMFIQPEAVDFLIERGDALIIAKKILKKLEEKPLILSISDIAKVLQEEKDDKELPKEKEIIEVEEEIEIEVK